MDEEDVSISEVAAEAAKRKAQTERITNSQKVDEQMDCGSRGGELSEGWPLSLRGPCQLFQTWECSIHVEEDYVSPWMAAWFGQCWRLHLVLEELFGKVFPPLDPRLIYDDDDFSSEKQTCLGGHVFEGSLQEFPMGDDGVGDSANFSCAEGKDGAWARGTCAVHLPRSHVTEDAQVGHCQR